MNAVQDIYQTPLEKGKAEIWLAGGCFWGTQEYLNGIVGVVATKTGYANGNKANPTYEEVCTGTTDFVEAVGVIYDTSLISLEFLLELYYESVNPTSFNRQGGDVGTQYRTGIYYRDSSLEHRIEASIEKLEKKIGKPVAIEVKTLDNFYIAEEVHQDYLEKNPHGYCHIGKNQLDDVKYRREYIKPTEEELKRKLTPLQYEITQEDMTEAPFSGKYDSHFEKGIYVDITTREPLFVSSDKFDAGCGWPAFSQPISEALIEEKMDISKGYVRTEVRSSTGDAHLGHVFSDGPEERGGMRYCINSGALDFIPLENMKKEGYDYLLHLVK